MDHRAWLDEESPGVVALDEEELDDGWEEEDDDWDDDEDDEDEDDWDDDEDEDWDEWEDDDDEPPFRGSESTVWN